jgi:hydroxymethylglutaryl-CoA lyase
MKLPPRVTLCEVGTRDGFQIEPDWIPTEAKVEVVNRLSATGVPRIEVTSFVSPKAVPALRGRGGGHGGHHAPAGHPLRGAGAQ